MNFQGVDYYNIEELLTEEEVLIRNTVREFVGDNILPIIEKHNRAGSFPIHLVPKMAELGMFGSTLPNLYEVEPPPSFDQVWLVVLSCHPAKVASVELENLAQ